MKRLAPLFAAIAFASAAAGFSPKADASVVVDFSGTFGDSELLSPGLLNDGSFTGSVTFSALPGAGSTVTSHSGAVVQLYDSSHNLEFTLTAATATLNQFTANATNYISLSIQTTGSGLATGPGGSTTVAPLSMTFTWPFGASSGTMVGTSLTYTATGAGEDIVPIVSGQAHIAPEPSTIGMSLIGVGALGLGALRRRRKVAV